MTKIQQQLFALRDEKYKAFHSKLIPTIDPQTIIGVRTPELRKLAKQIEQEPETQEFLHTLPHRYYEENNLHDFLLERIKDYPTFLAELNAFLPYIDNWAPVMDCVRSVSKNICRNFYRKFAAGCNPNGHIRFDLASIC